MKQITLLTLLVLLTNKCLCQKGFPNQFQAELHITGQSSWPIPTDGNQQLLYDYTNSRVRFDIQGWRKRQNETYMVINRPDGAESDSPASKGLVLFNFNPDFPEVTKHDCWYRTNPMADIGPFPFSWLNQDSQLEVKPWFPLPSNLIKKGEEWIPEVQKNAVRYDSPEICDLKRSGIGKVPCLSYFETDDGTPVKTIKARAAVGAYDMDEYVNTFYVSFIFGIPSEAEPLFNLPNQWPSYCGHASAGFTVDQARGFVVTPDGQDHFVLSLNGQPVHSLGDQVTIKFKVQPSWYYNGTQCATFNDLVFNHDNWQQPQRVDMSFKDYGCCTYLITGTGGGYEWQYYTSTITIYACNGQAGYGCTGKEPCGA